MRQESERETCPCGGRRLGAQCAACGALLLTAGSYWEYIAGQSVYFWTQGQWHAVPPEEAATAHRQYIQAYTQGYLDGRKYGGSKW